VATAIGTVSIVVDAIVPVYARAIVVEMATGAVRLVIWARPVHRLRITLMAARAGEIAGMIQWLVTQTHVLVNMRSPSIGRMTVTALAVRHEVPLVLAGRSVSIMAGRTGTQDLRVVYGCYRYPGDRRVTVLADVCRQDMRRVLTCSSCAIVAADAVIGDVRVVKGRRCPGDGGVAIVAVVAAGNVGRVLACRGIAVVAGEAGADDLGVIDHVGRREGHVVVAVLANIRRINMRRMLARSLRAIVTADAVVGDVRVVEVGRDPGIGRVAVVAVVAAGNVSGVLACRGVAVVAGEAGANDLGVIDHVGGHKRHNIVAVFTNHGGVDMCRVLADGLDAIMTAGAVRADTGVVKIGGRPGGRRVTVIAIVAARYMASILARCNSSVVTAEAGTNDLGMVNNEYRIPG